MSIPKPPTRDEMGPHRAEGAWMTAMLLLRIRYGAALVVLVAISSGLLYALALRDAGDKERQPLPVPPPTQAQLDWAEAQHAAVAHRRDLRAVYFSMHPDQTEQAKREGFTIVPADKAAPLLTSSATAAVDAALRDAR